MKNSDRIIYFFSQEYLNAFRDVFGIGQQQQTRVVPIGNLNDS